MKPKILFVDDEECILRSLERALREQDWDLITFSDPEAALKHLEVWRCDVIVSDYRMPVISGLEVLRSSRDIQPDAARILMTGFADIDIIIEAINQGNIFKYIAKPWENEKLIKTLNEAIDAKRKADDGKALLQSVLEEKSEWTTLSHKLEHQITAVHRQGVQALLKVIQAKDMELYQHSLRVTFYAMQLGERVGLKKQELEALHLAALFHDIGKIAIRDSVLYKEGKLDEAERRSINYHSTVSAEILVGMDVMQDVTDIVLQHHERWDGSGYPDGLRGNQINRAARILSVADIYTAMRETRPYKEGKTSEEALEVIRESSGKALDPKLTELWCSMKINEAFDEVFDEDAILQYGWWTQ